MIKRMVKFLYDVILGLVGWEFSKPENIIVKPQSKITPPKVLKKKKVTSNANVTMRNYLKDTKRGKKQSLEQWRQRLK